MYENTGPRAHQMAAELIEAGVDVARDLPAPLRGRAAGQARAAGARARERRALRRRAADGHAPERRGLRGDRRRRVLLRGRRRPPARARGHRGGRPRARPAPATASERRKVSLRATDDRVDVSAIARAQGGGGHRRAAGFSTDHGLPAAGRGAARRAWPSSSEARDGVIALRQAGGDHLARRRGGRAAAAAAAASRSATRARSTRSRPACCSCWSGARRACSAS